ncbi:MAG: glycine cleavage system aminomethyltransferase GcvT, partial [Thermoplasmata archaeon]|nr:glycine cleavage system aminomethyltransferase GcvT [Thermoplasmata archaeon]
KDVQKRIIKNAFALSEGFKKRGIGVAYRGTDTHLLLVDLKSLKSLSGEMLNGEIVSRILEICGIVCNKNTIAGDDKAAFPSGIRFGTPIVTQRGLDAGDMDELADIITRALKGMEAFSYMDKTGEPLGRIKMDYSVLENVKERVRKLTEKMGRSSGGLWDYPYFYSEQDAGNTGVFRVRGERAHLALNEMLGIDVIDIPVGSEEGAFITFDGKTISGEVYVHREKDHSFLIAVTGGDQRRIMTWMRGLSDGYLKFDEDILKKINGPFVVENAPEDAINSFGKLPEKRDDGITFDGNTDLLEGFRKYPDRFHPGKPYFMGHQVIENELSDLKEGERFEWKEGEGDLKKSCLYEEHVKLGATMVPFAGWRMPVKYGKSIAEEHDAVRKNAGLFDVTHMGVFGFFGQGAARFLDTITSNFVFRLRPGEAHYSYLVDHNGIPIDDIFLYMVDHDNYMMVVNAANIEKDKAWVKGVLEERYMMDRDRGHVKVDAKPEFLDLKDPVSGERGRVDIAFQGPAARKVLKRLLPDDADRKKLVMLKSSGLFRTRVAGVDTLIARTGYTGEDFGYELFVHLDNAPKLWNAILEEGKDDGVRPTGLGARDSTRIEAGLPLYGNELAGPYGISPQGAGYGYFVKFHKPFFAGREQLLENERKRKLGIARIAVEKGARLLKLGDYVVSKKGKCIGYITSSALVKNHQLALAYVKKNYISKEGASVGLIPRGDMKKAKTKDIKIGTPLIPVVKGEIMPRFFDKEEEWPEVDAEKQ